MKKEKIRLDKAPECMSDVFGEAAGSGLPYDPESMMTDMENWVRDHGVEVAVSPYEEDTYTVSIGDREVDAMSADAALTFLTGMGALIEYLNKSMEGDS